MANVMNDWVTVVIPVYNRILELDRCLNSLANQSIKTFKVIVCDDGSIYKDQIKNIIKTYQTLLKISLLEIKNTGGPAAPRNKAIKHVTTKWIAFLDSDDWWNKNKLEYIKPYIDKYDFIYHKMNIYDSYNGTFKGNIGRKYHDKEIAIQIFLHGNYIPTSSVVLKTSLLNESGFDENIKINSYEDIDLWIRLFSKNKLKIKFIAKKLGFYSLSYDSISKASINQIKSYLYFYYKNKHNIPRKYFNYLISYKSYKIGSIYFSMSNFYCAKKYFVKVDKLISLKERIKHKIKLIYCIYILSFK